MAAAKSLDTIFEFLGMIAEPSDAVSAYTQVKNEMLPCYCNCQTENVFWSGSDYHIVHDRVGEHRRLWWCRADGTNVLARECLCAHRELGRLVGLCGRHHECQQNGEHEADVEPFTKELDREDPTPLIKQIYFGRKQREAEVDHQALQPKGRIVSNNT